MKLKRNREEFINSFNKNLSILPYSIICIIFSIIYINKSDNFSYFGFLCGLIVIICFITIFIRAINFSNSSKYEITEDSIISNYLFDRTEVKFTDFISIKGLNDDSRIISLYYLSNPTDSISLNEIESKNIEEEFPGIFIEKEFYDVDSTRDLLIKIKSQSRYINALELKAIDDLLIQLKNEVKN